MPHPALPSSVSIQCFVCGTTPGRYPMLLKGARPANTASYWGLNSCKLEWNGCIFLKQVSHIYTIHQQSWVGCRRYIVFTSSVHPSVQPYVIKMSDHIELWIMANKSPKAFFLRKYLHFSIYWNSFQLVSGLSPATDITFVFLGTISRMLMSFNI